MSVAAGRIEGGRAGRPLRFLMAAMLAWTGFRLVALWPTMDAMSDLVRAVAPPAAAAERPVEHHQGRIAVSADDRPRIVPAAAAPERAVRPLLTLAVAPPAEPVRDVPQGDPGPPALPPPLATLGTTGPSRWSGSAWAIARGDGGGPDVLGGSQLGGSQAGARIAYALGSSRRVALVGRVATPLEGPPEGSGREMGLGAEVRIASGLRLVAEQRIALDGGRGGPSAFAVGGVGPVALGGFRLEAYGQAGAVKRRRIEPFADGAARIARPVLEDGRRRIDLGVGAWGGAQRDAARLDMGPSIGAVLPVGRRSVRLTLDWRQRVAGEARPGSGPALSAGMDF